LTSTKENPPASHAETATFKKVQCDNEADLVCGMPLTSGVGDTAHYEDKVFGFCSRGCKDKFSKDPTKYLAAK
jgi:YHS domain-containing protein